MKTTIYIAFLALLFSSCTTTIKPTDDSGPTYKEIEAFEKSDSFKPWWAK